MRTLSLLLVVCVSTDSFGQEWKKLPPLPDREGFAAPFAGVSHGALLVAGGANFPDKKPWEGGTKVWYDTVYVLEKPDGKWQVAGKLPRPLAYGVSVTFREEIVCVGGSDAKQHYADVFALEWKAGKLHTRTLPSLPKPLANACGTLVADEYLFICSGQEKPDSAPCKSTYSLRLSAQNPKWHQFEDIPGPARMLSVAGTFGRSFCVIGGVDLVEGKDGKPERKYLKDAYQYDVGQSWTALPQLPRAVTAAPSPAISEEFGFTILGGDDGTQVGVAPMAHRGFSQKMLRYDAKTSKWHERGDLPAPRVTVPSVLWGKSVIVPSGEMRPGVRSPEVWSWSKGR